MGLFKSLASEKFRKVFLTFFLLSSLLPTLILVYLFYQYLYPTLDPYQVSTVFRPFAYGLLGVLVIQLISFVLFFKVIKSFENITKSIIDNSADIIDGHTDFGLGNEISVLQTLFEMYNHELKQKISQLEENSTKLINANLKLSKMAMRDKLTTLFNRRYFDIRIVEEITRAERYGNQLCLMMIDVDDFKHYNDKFGHQTGDKLLVELSSLIHKSIRTSDIAFRYGGDELVIILPEISVENAHEMGLKLSKVISGSKFDFVEAPKGEITISTGVASLVISGDNLIHDADRNLYQAKESGRGQVVGPQTEKVDTS